MLRNEGSLVETGVYITLINIFGHMYVRRFLISVAPQGITVGSKDYKYLLIIF